MYTTVYIHCSINANLSDSYKTHKTRSALKIDRLDYFNVFLKTVNTLTSTTV